MVACGLLPAAWFHWFVPREQKRVVGALAAVPGEPGARLDAWLAYGEPMIQTRLQKLRFSTAHPWLVTHTRRTATGEPEIWGLDLDTPSPAQLVRAGLRVEVRLPAPRALGRGELAGSDAERVPSYGPGESPPDPAVRAGMLVEWFLAGMIEAVAEDIEGAELVVRIGASPPHAPGDGG
ncbi:MAG: hypothetical protein CMJ84_10700 [Planctomycetes bacterium]|nr:hypothetical protein [Planctomycetota bacterium]